MCQILSFMQGTILYRMIYNNESLKILNTMNVRRVKIAAAAALDTWVRPQSIYGITITGEVALNGAKDFCIEVLPASENDDKVLQRQIIPGDIPVIYLRYFNGTTWTSWALTGENAMFTSPTIETDMTLDFAKAAAGTTEIVTVNENGSIGKEVKSNAFNLPFGGDGSQNEISRADHTHIDVNYEVLGTAGEVIGLGALCFLNDDGKWYQTKAEAQGFDSVLGYAVSGAVGEDEYVGIRIMGVIPVVDATPGAKAYVGQDGGKTFTPPAAGEKSRCLGRALTATEFFFNPDNEYTVVPEA